MNGGRGGGHSRLRESGGQTTAVCNTTSRDDHDWLARQRALGVLAEVDAGGDKDGEWGVASVATALTTLCTDDIHT